MTQQFEALKRDIIRELFLKTADQTYVVARWCFLNRVYLDFYWNAAHGLEKYLKAALLMNDRSAIKDGSNKSYSHDIERLYAEVCQFAGDLMPQTLTRPDDLNIAHWRDETMNAFLKRLSNNGDPNNRYNLFGFGQHPEDLYKLDMAVFAIRRAVQPLTEPRFSERDQDRGAFSGTNLEYALRHPDDQPSLLGSKLDKLMGKKASEDVRQASLKHNLPFAPEEFEHGDLRGSYSADNPVLGRRILVALERPASSQDHLTADLADWAVSHIYFPNNVRKQLQDAAQELRDRAPKA